MVRAALQKIGLTEGEISVYLALLDLGETTTGPLTKKSGISGSKVYEVLDRLIDKGLASSIMKNNVRHFQASSPSRILDYLDEKKSEIGKEQKEIHKIIPDLILRQKKTEANQVRVYTGFEGAKTAYEDAMQNLRKGEEILGWGLTEQPESWEIYFNKREKFRDDKGVVHKSIINEKYKSLYNVRKKFKNTKIRFFPKELEMPTTIEIWKNKIALFIITKENPITIVIESQAAADSFKKYFNIMWKSAKKKRFVQA
jgi:sugar-specific transcriptional regulator TrmB